MAKILIVEDDRNLQTIYGDRLKAEGHSIITASDGEEALAVAVKEKPDLIISDVMMPKISGFDMLDILRTTPETRNVKIIMMTALSQAEDRERANKLGADKYLVKSQVTLDDVARTVNEVVGGAAATEEPLSKPVLTTSAPVDDTLVPEPPVSTDPQTVAASAPTVDEEQAKISSQIDDFISKNMPDTTSSTPQATQAPVSAPTVTPPTTDPIAEPAATTDSPKATIFELYEKELAKEAEAKAQDPTEPPKD